MKCLGFFNLIVRSSLAEISAQVWDCYGTKKVWLENNWYPFEAFKVCEGQQRFIH